MKLYLAKNRKLKMFPVQIQWELTSAVPFSSAAGGVSAVDGIAPTARIDEYNLKAGVLNYFGL